jgi:hypothetical protein
MASELENILLIYGANSKAKKLVAVLFQICKTNGGKKMLWPPIKYLTAKLAAIRL